MKTRLLLTTLVATGLWLDCAGQGFYPATANCPYKPDGTEKRPYWVEPHIRNDGSAQAVHRCCTATSYEEEAFYLQPSWQTAMDQLGPDRRMPDGRLKRDVERMRIFLKPDRAGADVYEISVSASCQLREMRWRNGQADESWSAGATARNTSWDSTSYGHKITIPFERLGGRPEPGAIWGFNVAREEAATSEHSNWAGVVGDENLTKRFGRLRFAGPDETMTVGIWLLARPLTPGVRFRVSYRFNAPEASGVSRMLVSDGGDVFEPSGAQALRPAPVPSWRPHFWTLPRGMPLRVQFVMDNGDTVYHATGPIPLPQDRADETAARLRESYEVLVQGAERTDNEEAGTAFLDALKPLREQVAAIADELEESMKQPSSGERSRTIDRAAGLLDPLERRAHLLASTLEVFQGLDRDADVPAFSVGHTHSLVKLRRFQSEATFGTPLKIELARGERESAQLVVVPFDRDLDGVSATWTDFEGPAGARLPAANVRLDVVGYVKTTPGGYPAPWTGWWPDPLLPLAPTDVPMDRIQPLWITVYAPPGTPAGIYRGKVTVSAANAVSREIPVEVEVWDYDLPLRGKFKTAIGTRFTRDIVGWYRFEKMENTFEAHQTIPREFRLKMYDLFLEHRVNPCALFEAYTMPEKEDVRYCLERGLNAISMLIPPGEVDERVIRHVSGWRDFLKEKACLDLLHVFGYDEIEDRPDVVPMMERERPKLKELFPEIPISCTINRPHPEWDSFIDIWIPTTYRYDQAQWVRHCKETGDAVWWYTACEVPPFAGVLLDVPAIKHRILFWQNFKYRVPGYLYYLATGWRANQRGPGKPRWPDVPWITASYDGTHNGCGQLLYPGKDGLLSSVRFAIIRDGIEDYEALAVLEELTDKLDESGRSPALVAASRKMLEVSPEVTKDLREYTDDPLVLLEHRRLLARQIVQTRSALRE